MYLRYGPFCCFRCRECLHVVIALVLALERFAIGYGKTETKAISMASYEGLA